MAGGHFDHVIKYSRIHVVMCVVVVRKRGGSFMARAATFSGQPSLLNQTTPPVEQTFLSKGFSRRTRTFSFLFLVQLSKAVDDCSGLMNRST